jgi:predicted Zn-dependent protease
VHFALGVLLASQGQSKPAQLELEKADALQPRTFEIPYSLGQTLLLNGKYPQAEIVLNRALALKPESPETLYLLAQALANESRPMDALALLVQQQDCGFVSGHDFSRATPRPKWFRL